MLLPWARSTYCSGTSGGSPVKEQYTPLEPLNNIVYSFLQNSQYTNYSSPVKARYWVSFVISKYSWLPFSHSPVYHHYIIMRVWMSLKSRAPWLFAQPFVQAQIQALCHWPLWGESTSDWWIPPTKGQLHRNYFYLMMSSCDIPDSTAVTQAIPKSEFALTKDIPRIILTDELLGYVRIFKNIGHIIMVQFFDWPYYV